MSETPFRVEPKPEMIGRAGGYLGTVYTNSTRSVLSLFDCQVVFAQAVPREGVTEMVVEDRVTVVMTPQHMKKLLEVLTNNLRLYESQYGSIPEVREGEQSQQATLETK